MIEAHSYGMAGIHLMPGLSVGDGARTLTDYQALRALGQLKLRCLLQIGLDGLDDALRLGMRIAGCGSAASRCSLMARLARRRPRCSRTMRVAATSVPPQ
jgi:hypothetical protein